LFKTVQILLKSGRVEALPLAAVRPRRVASRVGRGIFADPVMANPVGAGQRVGWSINNRQLHNYNHLRVHLNQHQTKWATRLG
jgi:hypothetical protein